VCNGLSCWHGGGREILEGLAQSLGIQPGETSEYGRVTMETTPCGFLYALAPAVEVDGQWRGRVSGSGSDLVGELE
jgi:NADH:ubiquinone oxidoreductase subunit E